MSSADTRQAGAEQLVCAYALRPNVGRDAVIEVLEEDSILTQEAQDVVSALSIHRDGERVTAISLRAQGLDPKAVEWVQQFEGDTYKNPFERAVEALRACRSYAAVARVLEAAVDSCVRGPMTDQAVTDLVGTVADTVQGLGSESLQRTMGDQTTRDWAEKWREQLREDTRSGACTWGVTDLDKHAGTFSPGSLTAVAGLPGHGKSVLAVNALVNSAASAKRCLYVCLEMQQEEQAKRLLCNSAYTYSHRAESIALEGSDDEWGKLVEGLPDVTLETCNLHKARALVREAYAQGKPYDLVVLDYLQMLTIGNSRENEATRLQETAYFMKNDIAMRYRCGVLVLCQFSKAEMQRSASDDSMPNFRNVRGASAIEDAVDIAVCIKRDAEPTHEDAGTLTGAKSYGVDFIVSKFRNGEPYTEDRTPRLSYRMVGGQFRAHDSLFRSPDVVREHVY